MEKQKFAWKPKKVWNMKTRDFRYTWIWLCWYWDDGSTDEGDTFFCLSSGEPMTNERYCRSNTNTW